MWKRHGFPSKDFRNDDTLLQDEVLKDAGDYNGEKNAAQAVKRLRMKKAPEDGDSEDITQKPSKYITTLRDKALGTPRRKATSRRSLRLDRARLRPATPDQMVEADSKLTSSSKSSETPYIGDENSQKTKDSKIGGKQATPESIKSSELKEDITANENCDVDSDVTGAQAEELAMAKAEAPNEEVVRSQDGLAAEHDDETAVGNERDPHSDATTDAATATVSESKDNVGIPMFSRHADRTETVEEPIVEHCDGFTSNVDDAMTPSLTDKGMKISDSATAQALGDMSPEKTPIRNIFPQDNITGYSGDETSPNLSHFHATEQSGIKETLEDDRTQEEISSPPPATIAENVEPQKQVEGLPAESIEISLAVHHLQDKQSRQSPSAEGSGSRGKRSPEPQKIESPEIDSANSTSAATLATGETIQIAKSPLLEPEVPNSKTRSGTRFSDDTSILKDFLNRAQARKQAQDATLRSEPPPLVATPRRSPRKALASLDSNSPSPHKPCGLANRPGTPPGKEKLAAFLEEIEGISGDLSPVRRSTRKRLLAPIKSNAGAPSFIPVRRADGTDPVVLQKSVAQELAIVTRVNTRRNKGQSKPPGVTLKTLTTESGEVIQVSESGQTLEGSKKVGWDKRLVYYQDTGAVDEGNEMKQGQRAKMRRARGLGASNGTPAPKRMADAGSASGTPKRQGRKRA